MTTNLVQVDAVVTDKSGKQVTDLRPEDFDIMEDGHPRQITNFSYITIGSAKSSSSNAITSNPSTIQKDSTISIDLRRGDVRRTVAVVVDDLGISFVNVDSVREALRKFVNEQLQPNDLVALIRTSKPDAALQRFTSDRRELLSAIDHLQWNSRARGGVSTFEPRTSPLVNVPSTTGRRIEEVREDTYAAESLASVNRVISDMRVLPGRKSMLLVSEGFPLLVGGNTKGRDDHIRDFLTELIDRANRAAVVIYAIDPRGPQSINLNSRDDLSDIEPRHVGEEMMAVLGARTEKMAQTQSSLEYLSQETGGLFFRNRNDLAVGLRQIMDDQTGYYLLGYRPDESTIDSNGQRRFRTLMVKVKRPGLQVRSRGGFLSQVSRKVHPLTGQEQLKEALASPFISEDVRVKLTTVFASESRSGSFIRAVLYIKGKDLSFSKEDDDWFKAVIDVVAITLDEDGQQVHQFNRTETLRARGDDYKRLVEQGLIYTINIPIKRPGPYQLRVAVLDTASARVGSQNRFVDIPNLSENHLVLSGIILSAKASTTELERVARSGAVQSLSLQGGKEGKGPNSDLDPRTGPFVRQFRAGMVLDFDYMIYNAQVSKDSNRPEVKTQFSLLRDGQRINTGAMDVLDVRNQADMRHLLAGGRLRLGPTLPPGVYVLEVVVFDTLGKAKYQTATQWIDFEVVQ